MNGNLVHLHSVAARLRAPWTSTLVGVVGSGNVKALRMDGAPYPEETHAYAEGLLVIEGHLNLVVEGQPIVVSAGELFVVPPGVRHSVSSGSHGTLVILDA